MIHQPCISLLLPHVISLSLSKKALGKDSEPEPEDSSSFELVDDDDDDEGQDAHEACSVMECLAGMWLYHVLTVAVDSKLRI